jgi:hypothetical protein
VPGIEHFIAHQATRLEPTKEGPMKLVRFLSVLFLLALFSTSADAAQKGGVTMPDTAEVGGKTLVLNGMGIREATILNIDVYVAGLYLETKSQDGGAILGSNENKRLVLKFVRDVEKNDVTKAWTEGFERNAASQLGALKARIDTINSWMADMKVGESMVFTYQAGKIEVTVKGASKGTIQGDDFARAFFSIWLGKPPNKGLKKGLLGK